MSLCRKDYAASSLDDSTKVLIDLLFENYPADQEQEIAERFLSRLTADPAVKKAARDIASRAHIAIHGAESLPTDVQLVMEFDAAPTDTL